MPERSLWEAVNIPSPRARPFRVADATIPEEYPQKKYRRLLTAGIWCQVEIAYLPENVSGGAIYPFAIQKLKPIQVATGGLLCLQGVSWTFPACLAS
jgi:predicted ATP-dependent Lon-type protease